MKTICFFIVSICSHFKVGLAEERAYWGLNTLTIARTRNSALPRASTVHYPNDNVFKRKPCDSMIASSFPQPSVTKHKSMVC
jgi:hypothetical protein